jgi:hypothetical protein
VRAAFSKPPRLITVDYFLVVILYHLLQKLQITKFTRVGFESKHCSYLYEYANVQTPALRCANKKGAGQRELIDTGTDKRYEMLKLIKWRERREARSVSYE